MEQEFGLMMTIGLIVALLLVFLLALANSRKIPNDQKEKILKQLEEVKYSMQLHNPAANRDGIVRLDAMLSRALQLKNRNSLNCGENLRKSKVFIGKTYYEDIWYFHKLRNQIVHENIEIENEDAIDAFRTYSAVINKLLK